MQKTIGIIGCGNMGSAILSKDAGCRFIVYDQDKTKLSLARRKFHVKAAVDITDLIRQSQVAIIAVKPQDIDGVLDEAACAIKLWKRKDILIISIAAGISTQYIENRICNKVKVVRAMPNLAATVGQGVTALFKGRFASRQDFKLARKLFAGFGVEITVKDEGLIDVVTAVSGSGPAYFFFIFSAICKVAEELGLDGKVVNSILHQTVIGAMKLLDKHGFDAQTLISRVTSKGGTTEAALKVFADRQLEKAIRDAVIAAYKRAGELSR